MKNKQSIMVVTGGYFPGVNYGGIATSRYNFTEAFGDEYDIVIVTKNHDYKDSEAYKTIKPGYNQYGKARVLYLEDEAFNGESFGKIMNDIEPSLVYASGTITSIFYFNRALIQEAKKRNIPVLITPDGDILDNALRLKKMKKAAALLVCRIKGFYKNVWFQATSSEERRNLSKYLGIRKDLIFDVSNMPHVFPCRPSYEKEKDAIKILFFSRIHPKKNLKFAIEVVSQLKTPKAVFDIYGSMEDEAYWQECCGLIQLAPPHIQISYKGRLDSAAAREIAKQYDCFFFPTISENYGYVIEEALLSGCPVILTKGTTPWDDVHGVAGFTAPLNDTRAFADELEKIAKMDHREYGNYCKNIRAYIENKLSYQQLCGAYRDMFHKIADVKSRNIQ